MGLLSLLQKRAPQRPAAGRRGRLPKAEAQARARDARNQMLADKKAQLELAKLDRELRQMQGEGDSHTPDMDTIVRVIRFLQAKPFEMQLMAKGGKVLEDDSLVGTLTNVLKEVAPAVGQGFARALAGEPPTSDRTSTVVETQSRLLPTPAAVVPELSFGEKVQLAQIAGLAPPAAAADLLVLARSNRAVAQWVELLATAPPDRLWTLLEQASATSDMARQLVAELRARTAWTEAVAVELRRLLVAQSTAAAVPNSDGAVSAPMGF